MQQLIIVIIQELNECDCSVRLILNIYYKRKRIQWNKVRHNTKIELLFMNFV